MTAYSGPWSQAEATAFLETATVPLRLGCRTPSDLPWILPLWFVFRDGQFFCATEASATVVEFIDHDPMVSFDVSTNDPPYRGVRGRGTATVERDPGKRLLRDLITRYLGTTTTDFAQWLLSADREEVTIGIDPARVHSWDFSERMPASIQDASRE